MLKIAHRGASAYEPENTLRSFQKALEFGVDAVELDVRMTKDDEIVVIHDDRVDRTTNGTGFVKDMTLSQIRNLVTERGERIPTLKEALDLLDRKAKILIELKEIGLEEKALDIIRERKLEKNVLIISFLEGALKRIRELNPEIETGLIYVRHEDPIRAALELKANYILPLYRFVNEDDIRRAHERNLKVIVWTINSREEVIDYDKKGADGIASDKPDILNL